MSSTRMTSRRGGVLSAALLLFVCGLQSPAVADDTKFIAAYQDAAQRKDGAYILVRVAKDFRWERDFGGGFDASRSAVANFNFAITLDNSRLRADAQDSGWKQLRQLLKDPLTANPDKKGELCTTPKDAGAEFPSDRLCFRESDGDWVISAYIGGGD